MANNNLPAEKKITFGQFLTSTGTQNLINRTLGDIKRAQRFSASVLSAVSVNPGLTECDPRTILSGAFLGDSLNLTPSPQLGQFYLVPFGDKKNPYGKVATFVLGYKGYIQLAIRSGYYKNINVIPIKEGEITKPWDVVTETIGLKIIDDDDKRDKLPTIGYYAMFEYLNGFTKALYWNKDKMLNHADRFSKAFNKVDYKRVQEGKVLDADMWKFSSFWYKDFDTMACKTMIRQLISKWGIMSVEMQSAFDADDNAINEQGSPIPDMPDPEPETPTEGEGAEGIDAV